MRAECIVQTLPQRKSCWKKNAHWKSKMGGALGGLFTAGGVLLCVFAAGALA